VPDSPIRDFVSRPICTGGRIHINGVNNADRESNSRAGSADRCRVKASPPTKHRREQEGKSVDVFAVGFAARAYAKRDAQPVADAEFAKYTAHVSLHRSFGDE
jgi:hypothetical protein